MARPTITPINAGNQGWDGVIDDDFDVLANAPIPVYESAALTEANVASTFPPASYDRCMVWVNHTTLGYTLYRSDGTNWAPFDAQRRVSRNITGATTITLAEQAALITASGTLPYSITLEAASLFQGRTLIFKTLVAGTLTIARAGGDTIDGATTQTITTQFGVLRIYCNGSTYYVI
jgi:hypothetical protein